MLNSGPLNQYGLNAPASPPDWSLIEIAEVREIIIQRYAPARRWDVSSSQAVQTIYLCELGDIAIPISSFQARLRDGQPSYMGVVIPGIHQDMIDAIMSMVGGTVTVHSGYRLRGGSTALEVLFTGTMHSLRYDIGARSASGTLVAYGTETTTTSKVVDLAGVSTIGMQATGKRNVRSAPSFFLRPGDVARWGSEPGDRMIVGLISITVDPRQSRMDLTER